MTRQLGRLEKERQGDPSGTYQLGKPKRSKVNGKAHAQCRTPAVIPGAATPRPKLGRVRRMFYIVSKSHHIPNLRYYKHFNPHILVAKNSCLVNIRWRIQE